MHCNYGRVPRSKEWSVYELGLHTPRNLGEARDRNDETWVSIGWW